MASQLVGHRTRRYAVARLFLAERPFILERIRYPAVDVTGHSVRAGTENAYGPLLRTLAACGVRGFGPGEYRNRAPASGAA